MNKLITTVFLCFCSSFFAAQAQGYTLNWASSFTPAWTDGATSGTATNMGGSGVDCSVSLVKSGGVFYTSHGGTAVATPTVSGSAFTVATSSANLEVALNYDTPTEYTDITFSFSAAVTGVRFAIGDLDKPSPTDASHLDQVVVTGSDGTTTHLPVLSKYDPTTDPNFLVVSGNTANANPNAGQGGHSLTNSTDQKGTVVVDFGTAHLNTVTIRFENAPGAHSNPTEQDMAIGNLTFQKLSTLPVTFASFSASAEQQKTILKWQTATEVNNSHFEIERNHGNSGWTLIGKVLAGSPATGLKAYTFTDADTRAGIHYYRIRQVDRDGSHTYSTITSVKHHTPGFSAEVFPNPIGATSTVVVYSPRQTTVKMELFDAAGRTLQAQKWLIEPGTNEIDMQMATHLRRGQYILSVTDLYTHHVQRIKLIK